MDGLVQIRVTQRIIIAEGRKRVGDVLWVSAERARDMIDQRVAEAVGEGLPGPAETKPQEPSEKKILRRRTGWPLDRFAEVERAWCGAVVVCYAGGPSLTEGQVGHVESVIETGGGLAVPIRQIAVNDAYRLAPRADVCYFADARWWRWHREKPEFQAFTGQKCSIFGTGNEIEDPEIFILRNGGNEGLSDSPEELCTGHTSGYQAINLAYLGGAARILLLGYDGKVGAIGETHWFGDHPIRSKANNIAAFARSLRNIAAPLRARGIDVINCSPDSAVDCFPRMDLEAAIEESIRRRPAGAAHPA